MKGLVKSLLAPLARWALSEELHRLNDAATHHSSRWQREQATAWAIRKDLEVVTSRVAKLEPWAREHRDACPELLAWAQYLADDDIRGFSRVHPFDRWNIFPKPE